MKALKIARLIAEASRGGNAECRRTSTARVASKDTSEILARVQFPDELSPATLNPETGSLRIIPILASKEVVHITSPPKSVHDIV